MTPAGISIVIPNYNGENLLRENLPSILGALAQWGGDHELIVVDDCSTDGSCRLLSEQFPQVKVIVNTHNMGFSKTCNIGMHIVKHPIALCINNDVKVNDDLILPLVKHFEDDAVFAVTPTIIAEREGRNQGVVVGLYGKGFLKGAFAPIQETHAVRENLYAIGACVAYDMEKFRALEGYADIYTPYLFEDVDISYRAWKRGWKSIYEPGTTVYHYSSATIGKLKKRHKRTVYFRNRFLFHWINLSDPALLIKHWLAVTFRLSVSFIWLDFTYYQAFFGALRRWRDVVALRQAERPHRRLSDSQIRSRTAR
ncbi:MAG: glycosyltransferase [Desulfuromonadales bacterium]|nr:glycosyltransferase [Desulfuromonadales bacterium]